LPGLSRMGCTQGRCCAYGSAPSDHSPAESDLPANGEDQMAVDEYAPRALSPRSADLAIQQVTQEAQISHLQAEFVSLREKFTNFEENQAKQHAAEEEATQSSPTNLSSDEDTPEAEDKPWFKGEVQEKPWFRGEVQEKPWFRGEVQEVPPLEKTSAKPVIVSNAASFAGSHLAKRLKEEGRYVRGVDNHLNSMMSEDAFCDEFLLQHHRVTEDHAIAFDGEELNTMKELHHHLESVQREIVGSPRSKTRTGSPLRSTETRLEEKIARMRGEVEDLGVVQVVDNNLTEANKFLKQCEEVCCSPQSGAEPPEAEVKTLEVKTWTKNTLEVLVSEENKSPTKGQKKPTKSQKKTKKSKTTMQEEEKDKESLNHCKTRMNGICTE